MKILFVWSGLTGYMGSCWRELASRPGVDLKVVVDCANDVIGKGFNPSEVMAGLDWAPSLDAIGSWGPDTVFSVGWHNKVCRSAALRRWGASTKKVCCFDMPWEFKPRKFAARFVLWRYLRNFDAAFVPGASAARYARWLGFGENRIFCGLFSTDTRRFELHKGGAGFLCVGRDAPEKGFDILRAAHSLYVAKGGTWPLKIVSGVAPSELGPIYAETDCFVLASRCEPWGVVLAEAAAAGLPIICTDVCGARHELVKGNGLVVKAGSARALADAMLKVGGKDGALPDGEIGRVLAKQYSCAAWADRVVGICEKLAGDLP